MFLTDEWHDVRFGPLQNLWGERVLPPSPPWWCFTCELSRTPVGEMFGSVLATVSGVALDRHIALARVCGESLERYCGMTFYDEAGWEISIGNSGFIDKLARCQPSDLSPDPFTAQWLGDNPAVPIRHVCARSFADEQGVWVPDTLVSLAPPPPREMILSEITSSGMAFGRTLVDALWAGLRELIERDSAMISWWCRCPAKRLVRLECQPRLSRYVEQLSRCQITPYLFDISHDIQIPTVACLLRSERYPFWTVGSACHGDPIQACLKSVDEAISVRIMLDREHIPHIPLQVQPQNALERGIFYGLEASDTPFQFLFNSPVTSVELWSRQEWLRSLNDLIRCLVEELGYTPVWKDLTTGDVTSLGYVIRALVPELVPMSQEFKWLDTPRLEKFRSQDWNPYPHPFA